MSNNNDRFLSAYNRLDNYLQSIVKIKGHINMISYLERILPEKKRAELKTIREFKNITESHGVHPGYKKPDPPEGYIQWLLNELEWCKQNKNVIAPKLQALLDKKAFPKNEQNHASSNNNNKNNHQKNNKKPVSHQSNIYNDHRKRGTSTSSSNHIPTSNNNHSHNHHKKSSAKKESVGCLIPAVIVVGIILFVIGLLMAFEII